MGDGGGGDGGSAVMASGGGACAGSGGVSERDCCRLPGVIQELWEDLPYSFPFFLEFLLNKGGCRSWWCVLGEVTEVHVIDIFVGIDFQDLLSNFFDCGRFLKE